MISSFFLKFICLRIFSKVITYLRHKIDNNDLTLKTRDILNNSKIHIVSVHRYLSEFLAT